MGVGGVTSSHEDHHRIEEQQKATILALQNQLTTVQGMYELYQQNG